MSEAKTYRRAADIVAGMDPRTRWSLPPGRQSGLFWQCSQTELAIWDGYAGAAHVLRTIADSIEREELTQTLPHGSGLESETAPQNESAINPPTEFTERS